MNAREEAFEKAGFTNDMIFREVMRFRPHICRKIIKICCPDMDTENMTVVTEHEVIASIEDRRVRLDVLSEKEGDRVDIEMYRYDPGLARQMRYHTAMLDSQLPFGSKPKEMPDVTAIALCTFDPFDRRKPVYSVRSMVEQCPEYANNESRRILFVSPTHEEKAPEELRPLLALLKEGAGMPDDPFVREVQEAVREVKTNREFRRHFMEEMAVRQAMRDEGYELGKAEGIGIGEARGIERGRAEGIERGREETIIIEIGNLRSFGIGEDRILHTIMKSHSLSRENALQLMQKSVSD